MASTLKVDTIQTNDGTGTIALQNQLSGLTTASLPTVTTDKLGAGAVLQVVQTANSSATSTTTSSTSFVSTGISRTITPLKSNSLILVQFNSSMVDVNTESNSNHIKARMYVNGSALTGQYGIGYQQGGGRYTPFAYSGQYTASSTSTLTFEVYFSTNSSSHSVNLTHSQSSWSFTLTEVAQ